MSDTIKRLRQTWNDANVDFTPYVPVLLDIAEAARALNLDAILKAIAYADDENGITIDLHQDEVIERLRTALTRLEKQPPK